MKYFIVCIFICGVVLSGCSNGNNQALIHAKTYSGKVSFDCMSGGASAAGCQNTSGKSVSLMGASLFSTISSSLSDPVSTITTTFQGSDVSISLDQAMDVQGSITNDTPNTIMGLWYFPVTYPIDGNPAFTDGWWGGDIITLQPGESFAFSGGMGFGGNPTYRPVPGPVVWTAYFFDTTGETNVPTVWHDGIDAVLAYGATHTPRAVGYVLFNVVP